MSRSTSKRHDSHPFSIFIPIEYPVRLVFLRYSCATCVRHQRRTCEKSVFQVTVRWLFRYQSFGTRGVRSMRMMQGIF
jgi:hypothetical protein